MAPLPLRTWLAGTPPSGEGAAGTTTVVIDVLRASTTAATALAHGAAYVIPRTDLDDAFAARGELERRGEEPILGGERGGFKVPGFDLGNSPLEYAPARVSGRPLILCTSNGTAALERCRDASRLYAASFVNAGATAAAVAKAAKPVTICCAGKEGAPSLEDICCAGLIASLLLDKYAYETDDATALALVCWKNNKRDVIRLLKHCSQGRYLQALGFEPDLGFCGQVDALAVAAEQAEAGKLVAVAD